jgi:hypothetical protein
LEVSDELLPVSATSSAGTLGRQTLKAITGNTGTGSVGTITATIRQTVTITITANATGAATLNVATFASTNLTKTTSGT